MIENRKNKLPISVADILVDDILESSDDDILNEAREQYGDINSEVEKTRNIISIAVMKSRKSRLSLAREQLEKSNKVKNDSNILTLPISEKRKLINHAKDSISSLTLAARNGDEMSESDTDGILQDLIDLGVIDENGNIK